MDCVYRFRSAKALLESFQELQNQEIYFAPPEELNDPMEGFKDIVWRGDAIVWTNLLRHYLLCLMRVVQTTIEQGSQHKLSPGDIPVLSTDESLPPPARRIFRDVSEKFFANQQVAELPALLAQRTSPARRNELLSLFFFIHFRALKTTCTALSPDAPLCAIDRSLRGQQDHDFRFRQYFAAMKAVEEKYPNSADITDQMSLAATSFLTQTVLLLQSALPSNEHEPAWREILTGFPETYLGQLERLLYRDWYVACFVADPRHAAMWGNYGDGHSGVCLKFKTRANTSGEPSLMLRTPVGATGRAGEIKITYRDVPNELRKVRYTGLYPEIDFFRSMGRLTGPQLGFWFRGPAGEASSTGVNITAGREEWRQAYWSSFYDLLTTKLSDWRHEDEHRIIFHSLIFEFPNKQSRKLRYRFEDLEGIIFGIKTPAVAKIEIRQIIEAKCKDSGRSNFDFYQAYYSRQTGKIETAKLSFLNFSGGKGTTF